MSLMQMLGSFAGESGHGGRKSKRGHDSGKSAMSKNAAYIFSSLIVPYIFSKIIKPLRFRMRIWLAKQYKKSLRREGKRAFRTKAARFALQHLDTYTSKQALFAFYLALIFFLRTILPHFQTALRTLVRKYK